MPESSSFDRPVSMLVVDRQLDASHTLDVLAASNSHVDRAPDFPTAVALIEASCPDVLITECRLREYNGLHLAMRLRAVDPTAVAIVLTSFPDPVLEREAERLGAVYLTKPVTPAVLYRVITDGLTRRFAGARSDVGGMHVAHASWDLGRFWSSH